MTTFCLIEKLKLIKLYCLSEENNGTCIYEPRCEKTGLRGFSPGPTQTGLCSPRRWLEA